MTWLVLGVLLLLAVAITIGIVFWAGRENSVEEAKQQQLAEIRARYVRSTYELNQAAVNFQRAASDAIERARREHKS